VDSEHGLAYFQKNGVVESGWRIPTKTDFDVLMAYIGGANGAGDKLKEEGTVHWQVAVVQTATDDFGFTMLPSGRRFQTGSFSLLTTHGLLWTNTPATGGEAYNVSMMYSSDDVNFYDAPVNQGFAIRCVRDI
jgi:uncharacterized protein (TIGR02145 family)